MLGACSGNGENYQDNSQPAGDDQPGCACNSNHGSSSPGIFPYGMPEAAFSRGFAE
jgi:hypothetical protein